MEGTLQSFSRGRQRNTFHQENHHDTRMSQEKFVIIGGGIAGLMIARFIRARRDAHAEIVVVERESHFGGQYSCIDYGDEGGRFDHGMHVFYETCIPEADRLFTSIFPDSDWHILEQNWKDVAGIYVHGQLQARTPWVDLRHWPDSKLRTALGEMLLAIRDERRDSSPPAEDAHTWLLRHYGRTLADEVYVPILQKLYYRHASELAAYAVKIAAINRVVMFDEALVIDLMKSESLRARIGYPDQYALPPCRNNSQRAFYPRQFGFHRVMDRLREVVESEDTHLMPSTQVHTVETSGDRITAVRVQSKDGRVATLDSVTELYWTSGLPPLARAIGVSFSDLQTDFRPAGWYVHFLLAEPPAMDRLYYFYSFEPGTRSFRITNYASYCPAAATARGYPLCVEFWSEPGDNEEVSAAIDNATRELEQFGVIRNRRSIRFASARRVGAGVGMPLPTVTNTRSLATLRERILERGLANLRTAGVMAEANVFFVPEVLSDAWHKVTGEYV